MLHALLSHNQGPQGVKPCMDIVHPLYFYVNKPLNPQENLNNSRTLWALPLSARSCW
jgi:hypothetical protein